MKTGIQEYEARNSLDPRPALNAVPIRNGPFDSTAHAATLKANGILHHVVSANGDARVKRGKIRMPYYRMQAEEILLDLTAGAAVRPRHGVSRLINPRAVAADALIVLK